jgi:hypothetical protein
MEIEKSQILVTLPMSEYEALQLINKAMKSEGFIIRTTDSFYGTTNIDYFTLSKDEVIDKLKEQIQKLEKEVYKYATQISAMENFKEKKKWYQIF